ncbi:TrkH family potassium uptake protein [Microbacterium sp. Sa4CUA7]|uniref:TrkH family potassium uptake protein n=1 Tax=Microbacterium pullorum TaxID=2762236 RepID=A0ABR8S0J7_9MICO|nr:potassium transporter TrkG [Microbacterium pullorum]MBD7956854.1 TrkH family potassium uptake protein [Microbacterium pullorum]
MTSAQDDHRQRRSRVKSVWRAIDQAIRRSAAQASVAIFVAAAVLFSGLLALPIAAADGRPVPVADAIFTAVSAITVTGLTTIETATAWSPFGLGVILVAIEVGGLGVITIALFLARAVTRRLGLGGRIFAQQNIGAPELGEVRRLLGIVVGTTLTIQGVLALLLAPPFIAAEGWAIGLWHALFYAVSAFNNAGFTTHVGGLAVFEGNLFVLVPIAVGVFVGSFGFPVFLNLIKNRWDRAHWTLHTKLTLSTTLLLLVVGATAWTASEWGNVDTIGEMNVGEKIFNGLFASTMMRSGGFAITDTAASTTTTLLLSDALMFIGGGSASTAGGIKVTTLAILFLAIVAEARGTKDVRVARRTIPDSSLRVAISVTFLGATLVLAATTLITLTHDAPLDRILFEVISAFATCGLSVGLSAELDTFGKMVLSVLMLAGRIGPIGLASALAIRHKNVLYTYATERPIIG